MRHLTLLSYWDIIYSGKIAFLLWNRQADTVRTSQEFLNSAFSEPWDILRGKQLVTLHLIDHLYIVTHMLSGTQLSIVNVSSNFVYTSIKDSPDHVAANTHLA